MRRLSITAALFLGTAVAFAAMDPFDGMAVPMGWTVSGGASAVPAAPKPTARTSCPATQGAARVGRVLDRKGSPACPQRARLCAAAES